MGLAGARNSAVTGLQAQSTNIAITSDNIANASTVGFKAVKGSFSTLVTGSGDSSTFSSGGVNITPQTLIEQQGLIESTGRVTDLAISGSGFFAVEDDAGTLLLTRAGSFSVNNKGELTNAAGFKLLGWALDNDGRRPGEVGNINTTAAESTDSLSVVDTNAASGAASPTTSIKVGMNLDAGETTYQGATVTLDPVSTANSTIAQGDIIIPSSTMQKGDSFTFTSNSASSTFQYGGFATSKDISLSSLYGATTSSTTFTTTGGDLTEGDKFSIATTSSGTATFTFKQSSPDTNNGQFNSLTSLATAINSTSGLTARVASSGTVLYVSSDIATEAVTFANVTADSNMVSELGFSNVAAAASTINRFNTMAGLEILVDAQAQLGAVVNNPTSGATLDIFALDPLQTLTLTKVKSSLIIDLQSDENGNNTSTQLIAPVGVDGASTMIPDITGLAIPTVGAATITFHDLGVPIASTSYTYGGIGQTKAIGSASTIFGASTAAGGSLADTTDRFVTGTGGLDTGDTITFSDGTGATATVTFQGATATASLGNLEFNSLPTLATALNNDGDFIAKVVNGRLYVAAAGSANRAVLVSGTVGITIAQVVAGFGGDFVDAGATSTIVTATSTGSSRFASLAHLNTLLEAAVGTIFTTTDPTSSANTTLTVSTTTANRQITVGGSNNAQLLAELGITAGTVGNGFFTELGIDDTVVSTLSTASDTTSATSTKTDDAVASATIAVTYNPADPILNMAGGNVTPHFTRNIRVYDALGTGHDFRLSYLKTGTNEWAVEFYAITASEIANDTNLDGLLVSGTITFNGDGSLATISAALTNDIDITWTTGSSVTTFAFDLGTAGLPSGTVGATVIGLTDGVRQFDTTYNVDFVEQNGVAAGQFGGIEVAEDGTVSAKFSNGQIKAIYKLPILTIPNQNALLQKSGNVFSVTQASGDVNIKQAGIGGAGVIVPGSLEGSTADIASELTKTIGIQANYNANAALISTVKAMEEELNRRL